MRFFAEFTLVSRSSERSEEEILRSLLSLRMTGWGSGIYQNKIVSCSLKFGEFHAIKPLIRFFASLRMIEKWLTLNQQILSSSR